MCSSSVSLVSVVSDPRRSWLGRDSSPLRSVRGIVIWIEKAFWIGIIGALSEIVIEIENEVRTAVVCC